MECKVLETRVFERKISAKTREAWAEEGGPGEAAAAIRGETKT